MYIVAGLTFPISLLICQFVNHYPFAFHQWSPEVFKLLTAFDRMNNWFNCQMGLEEFRAVYRVKTTTLDRHYVSFRCSTKLEQSWFGVIDKTARDWWKDELKVFGPWDKYARDAELHIPQVPVKGKADPKAIERLNEVQSYREDLILAAFEEIPEKLRSLQWLIHPDRLAPGGLAGITALDHSSRVAVVARLFPIAKGKRKAEATPAPEATFSEAEDVNQPKRRRSNRNKAVSSSLTTDPKSLIACDLEIEDEDSEKFLSPRELPKRESRSQVNNTT